MLVEVSARQVTMEKEHALVIRNHALKAIRELMDLLHVSKDKCDPEQYEQIKRCVGLSIGRIQMEILEIINAAYPELDDLIDQPDDA
jgi:hypothetical protein